MTRRALHWLPVVVMIALLAAAAPAPRVQAQTVYPPDGLFYGPDENTGTTPSDQAVGDNPPYQVFGYSDALSPGGRVRSTLYYYYDSTNQELYFAVVLDRSHNDNTYYPRPPGLNPYMEDAGWTRGRGRQFGELEGSDRMTFGITCGENPVVASYTWAQDYLYQDDTTGEWLSDENGDDIGCLDSAGNTFTCAGAPSGLVSSSSLAWNMNNSTWSAKLTNSPNTGDLDKITDEDGYPPYLDPPDPSPPYDDNITWEDTYNWEWSIVYEFAFPLPSGCTADNWYVEVPGSHSSPAKDDDENAPLSVELLSFLAQGGAKSVALSWETASEVDNLGFNLWRAEAIDGERIQINRGLIRSQVPPGSPFGAQYRYLDRRVRSDKSYFYWLQDLDIYGQTGWSDPVVATTTNKQLRNAVRR